MDISITELEKLLKNGDLEGCFNQFEKNSNEPRFQLLFKEILALKTRHFTSKKNSILG